MNHHLHARTHGGALVISVLSIAILAATAASVLSYVSSKHRNLSHATSWRKALVAAESGIDFSMQKLKDAVDDPTGAWNGWSTTDPNTGATLPNSGKCYTATALTHGGQGGTTMNYFVVVDTPASLAAASRTKQYYRIRSTGYADLSGTNTAITSEALDTNLRKLSFRKDRKTQQALTKPRASRTIEIVAAPETEIKARNIAHVKWDMQNWKNETRAYDSSDSTYSTGGRWDPAKQVPNDLAGVLLATNQWHADYEKRGTLEKVDLTFASVYGDFAALAGPVNRGDNVMGETFFDTYTELPKVLQPTWTSLTDTSITKIEGKPTAAQKAAFATWWAGASAAMKAQTVKDKDSLVLRGSSSQSSPATYKVSIVKMDKKDESLVFANPPGVTESWIEIWTTEEFIITKGGTLAIEDGVHATVHFEKKLEVIDTKKDGGGTFVESGFAGDLIFRGIEQAESSKIVDEDFSPVKTSGLVKVNDPVFTGVIFAPDYDMQLSTRNSSHPSVQQYILGSVTGRKIQFRGQTDFITDLALSQAGNKITGYRIASWFEDSE